MSTPQRSQQRSQGSRSSAMWRRMPVRSTKNGPWTAEDEGDIFFRNVANHPATQLHVPKDRNAELNLCFVWIPPTLPSGHEGRCESWGKTPLIPNLITRWRWVVRFMPFALPAAKFSPVSWVHLRAGLIVLGDKENFEVSGIRIAILVLSGPSCGYCGWCWKHVEQVKVFKVTVHVIFISIRWIGTGAPILVQMSA